VCGLQGYAILYRKDNSGPCRFKFGVIWFAGTYSFRMGVCILCLGSHFNCGSMFEQENICFTAQFLCILVAKYDTQNFPHLCVVVVLLMETSLRLV
jgi:hypothetical protein